MIHVMAAKVDDKVVLWEVNPEHPGGEVFIAGDGRTYECAETPSVLQRLAAGRLVKVQGAPPAPAPFQAVGVFGDVTDAPVADIPPTFAEGGRAANKGRATGFKALN